MLNCRIAIIRAYKFEKQCTCNDLVSYPVFIFPVSVFVHIFLAMLKVKPTRIIHNCWSHWKKHGFINEMSSVTGIVSSTELHQIVFFPGKLPVTSSYSERAQLGPLLGSSDLSGPFSWLPGNSSCRLPGCDVGLLRCISSAAEAEDDVTAVGVRLREISVVGMSPKKQTRFLCQSNKFTKYQFHNHWYLCGSARFCLTESY